MDRKLPVINIKGTDFIVDVNSFELIEKANPQRKISLFLMEDVGDGYICYCDPMSKGIISNQVNRKSVVPVKIPQMVTLDPQGMSMKHNVPLEEIRNKTDFELMVDQQAFDARLNKGILPTLDIKGHTFYVDIKMDMLRPKGEFLSKGIAFSEISTYYDMENRTYTIPYNHKTHSFEEIDYLKIIEYPKDIVAVSFPYERIMDRLGYNMRYGLPITNGLKIAGLHLHHKAKVVPWDKQGLTEVIKENLEKQKKSKSVQSPLLIKPPKGKGRKM